MTQRARHNGIALGAAVGVLAIAAALALLAVDEADGTARGSAERPNIVVIMTDDQDLTSMRVMPKTKKLLGERGTTFANSLASNPVCCPSRTTFLTGRYSHNTGVYRNSPPNGGFASFDDSETLPVWLQESGYETALIGKYLNGYGFADPTYVPPGWSEWYGATDPTTYRMYGYTLNENGTPITYGDYDTPDPALYQTDVYAEKAVDFISRRAPDNDPFFLQVNPLAPHTEVFNRGPGGDDDPPTPSFPNPRPAPRDAGAFADEGLNRTPAFNEADVSDKPLGIRSRPLLSSATISMTRNRNRSRLASLLAVDDMVSQIVSSLRGTGELDDTVIVFTSDNGFQLGEHRIPQGKQQPYEGSLRVPLLIRGPRIPRGEARQQLSANVDLAPTIAALAGTEPGGYVDGRSLLPTIAEPKSFDGRSIVIENWCQTNELCFDPETPRYRGVRTDLYTYVRHSNGEQELYDLERDPYQLRSRHESAAYVKQRRALDKLLDQVELCKGRGCKVSPEVKLGVDFDRGQSPSGRTCSRSSVVLKPEGSDGRRAIAVALSVPGGKQLTDEKRPLRFRLPFSTLERGEAIVQVSTLDGRIETVTGKLPRPC